MRKCHFIGLHARHRQSAIILSSITLWWPVR